MPIRKSSDFLKISKKVFFPAQKSEISGLKKPKISISSTFYILFCKRVFLCPDTLEILSRFTKSSTGTTHMFEWKCRYENRPIFKKYPKKFFFSSPKVKFQVSKNPKISISGTFYILLCNPFFVCTDSLEIPRRSTKNSTVTTKIFKWKCRYENRPIFYKSPKKFFSQPKKVKFQVSKKNRKYHFPVQGNYFDRSK